jgi:hypothetical protein
MKYFILSFLTYIIVFSSFLLASPQAQSGVWRFGKDINIVKIQDVKMKGPNGEALFLGYLLETDYFLLGTQIEDKGYVIGVRGISDGYYRLPDDQKLQIAKRTGLLPREFPAYAISPTQYLMGYSLWLSIAILGLWMFLANISKKPHRQ